MQTLTKISQSPYINIIQGRLQNKKYPQREKRILYNDKDNSPKRHNHKYICTKKQSFKIHDAKN